MRLVDDGWFQVICEVCHRAKGWANRNGGWDSVSPCACGGDHRVCADCRIDGSTGKTFFAVCPLTDEAKMAKAVMG